MTPVWTQPTRAHGTRVTVAPSPSPQGWWPRIAASVCLRLGPRRTCIVIAAAPELGPRRPEVDMRGGRGWAGNPGAPRVGSIPGSRDGGCSRRQGCFPGACRDSRQVFKRAGACGRGKFPAGTLGTRSEDPMSPASVAGLLFGSHPSGDCLVLLVSGTRRLTPTWASPLPGI